MKEAAENEQQLTSLPVIESIGQKPFLSPREAAKLLGVGKTTIYRYMAQGYFKVFRSPAKTIIRRTDLEAMFDNAPAYVKRNNKRHNVNSDVYTMKEIMEKYQITKRTAMRRIDRFSIAKIYDGRNVSYSKTAIDKYFAELAEEINVDDYYTPEQMMEKFNMSRTAVVSFCHRNKIPRINRHHDVYYSKVHVDSLKGTGDEIAPLFYTYKEIKEKYGFSKDQISYYIHTYNVVRKKRGSFTLVMREDFDRIIKERMNGNLSIADINAKIENAREVKAEMESMNDDGPLEIIPYSEEEGQDENDNYGKVEGYINAEEIAERYKQSKKWVHYLTRQKKIPRIQKAGFLFYDEKAVEEVFGKYASVDGITEWYTTDDIEQKYNMTPVARRSFTHRHNIPTKKEYGITYYSKLHVDFARNPGTQYAEDYYMVEQIMAKYHVDRATVYGLVHYKKVPSVKDGQYSLYLKTAIDKLFDKADEE